MAEYAPLRGVKVRKADRVVDYGLPVAALPGQPAGADSRARADQQVAVMVGGLLAIGLALLLDRVRPELGFVVLCGVSIAAGWSLSRRATALICLALAGGLAASVWTDRLPWGSGVVELSVAMSLATLAHVAAEGALGKRVSAANERQLRGVTFLLETAEFMATTTDQDVILNTAVHAAAGGISRSAQSGSAHAAFHEVKDQQVTIALVADEPRSRLLATGFEYPVSRNQAAQAAIRTRRPAIVRPDHLTGSLRSLADDLGWQVLIMAPVYCGGSLRGLLAASARDGPAVDQLQLYMMGRLARFTSASLDSAAAKQAWIPVAAAAVSDEVVEPRLPTDVAAVEAPISADGAQPGGEEVTGAFDNVHALISTLADQASVDMSGGLLSREAGLVALEREVLRSRTAKAGRHCLAVLRVPASADSSGGGEMIRLVADRLHSYLRRDDLIFKYADDEIVCSFADTDAPDVHTILDRLQSELSREIGFVPFTMGLTSLESAQTAS